MRNALRRIAFGVLGTGMVVAMAAGPSAIAANAAVSAPSAATVSAGLHPALIWPVVRKGDHGPRVVKVQYLLNQHGIHVNVDGKFGHMTKWGVKLFQKRHHIYPSGVVSARTWEKLIVTIRKGSKGYAVMAAQYELRYSYGYKFVVVDGKFGQMTEWAVKLFQKKYRLVPDGVVGSATWNAMVVHEK
jgi:peptidoglycan hydrolase-like protein with peptidoglycan-binding domain